MSPLPPQIQGMNAGKRLEYESEDKFGKMMALGRKAAGGIHIYTHSSTDNPTVVG